MQARRLILMILPLAFARALPAQQVGSHTLVYAVYQGEATAGAVLGSMRKAQHATGERIESYALVSRAPDGKMAVQERPAERTPAIQAMLGALGQPSGGTAAATSAIGSDVINSLWASLTPGSSAVIAVLEDRWVREAQRELRAAQARAMMFTRITQDPVDAGEL